MEVTINYTPRDEAVDRFHDRQERLCYWIAHRRRGKTVAIANDGVRRLVQIPIKGREHAPPKIAWMYPSRVRAKDIAWSYLKYYTSQIPGTRPIESELAIEFSDGRRFTLYGADGHRGVGQYLDGIYYDERDDIPEGVVVDLAPTLVDYGGFEVHAGMLRGRYRLWKLREKTKDDPNVLNMLERASETGVIPPHELANLRVSMGESAYQMQMECNPNAALANAIYGTWMEKARLEERVCKIPWETSVPIDWFADIGHSMRGDDWSWWGIQMKGRDILLQQYFSNTNKAPSWYASEVLKHTEKAGCPMGTVFLPHDGSHQDRKGKTARDDLMEAGIARCKVVPRTPHLWDSINDVRDLFNRFWIDETRCDVETKVGTLEDGSEWILPGGLDCLELYSKKERTDGIPGEEPDHNAYSHGADALRTYSEAFKRGMLDGTSPVAQASRRGGPDLPKVLRGPSSASYPVGGPRNFNKPRVLR
jgi:phage terminase large subunit